MTAAWRGRYGAILLGPTEDRVARYLEAATKFGRVTLRTTRIQDDLALGRSETYRILRTLRSLGLFGIENDQGGQLGGRRIWRIAKPTGATALDPTRHRTAWARVTAWLKARKARILAAARRLVDVPDPARPSARPGTSGGADPMAPRVPTGAIGPPLTMRDAVLRWAPALAKEWRLTDG